MDFITVDPVIIRHIYVDSGDIDPAWIPERGQEVFVTSSGVLVSNKVGNGINVMSSLREILGTSNNGLTTSGNVTRLGGEVIFDTVIYTSNSKIALSASSSGTNSSIAVESVDARVRMTSSNTSIGASYIDAGPGGIGLTSIDITGINTGSLNISSTGWGLSLQGSGGITTKIECVTGIRIVDSINSFGAYYFADYSVLGHSNPRWIPDLGYISAHFAGSGASGTVTSVTSANANITIATTTTTPVLTIIAAPKLTTARTIQGVSFDGTANINIINGTGFVKSAGTTLSYDNTSYVPIGGTTMTGFLTLSADPTSALHAATKSYVDNLITGITWKQEVRVATTVNITLSGTQTIDGIAVIALDRVLVKSQTTQSDNGIYVVSAGAWSRSLDADTPTEIATATVFIRLGTINRDTQWTCTNSTDPVIGTDAITFGQIAGAGTYTSSSGVSLTGNVFTLDTSFTKALLSATSPIFYNSTTGVISSQAATTSVNGYLTSTDWNTFNNKLSVATATSTYVPYTGATSTLDLGSNALTTTGIASLGSVAITGTAGVGLISLPSQSSPPTTPSTNFHNIYANSSGQMTFVGSNGFGFSLSRASLTASRIYTFPDVAGTFALQGTTLSSYGITDAYPLTGNPSGFLTANQSITLTGDITGSGSTSITTTLASVGIAGTYGQVTTDAKGRVTSGAIINPIATGGTGSATQNWVDLTTAQTGIAGTKQWTGIATFLQTSIGPTNVTDGVIISNSTAAINGTQQLSPALHLSGQGFATTPGTSQDVSWYLYVQGVQSTANPTSQLVFASGINGATPIGRVTISSNASLNASGTGAIMSNTRLSIGATTTTGMFSNNSTASTSGVAEQRAPAFEWSGHVWNTTAVAVDNVFGGRVDVRGISGTTPTAKMFWQMGTGVSTITYTDRMSLDNAGTLSLLAYTTKGMLANSSAGVLSSFADGTANQVLGMNSGATGYEYKTVTAGNGVSVTHGANSITIAEVLRYAHNISTPTTGGTVNLTNNQYNIINPAGALVTLTVSLPASPANNDTVFIKFTQNVTTVTYSGGTVVDGITAPTAGGLIVLVYDSGTTSWY